MSVDYRLWKLYKHLICLFLLVTYTCKISSQDVISFKQFSVEDGLSSESVLSITQDKKGFLWIGTMDGLNRFDGKRVRVFKSFYKDNPIGPSIKISCLLTDRLNQIWIGTNNGLYVYNNAEDTFSVFFHVPQNSQSLSNNTIKSLFMDRYGTVWVGTDRGLNKVVFNGDRSSFLNIRIADFPEFEQSGILCIGESGNDKLLAGTGTGLIELKPGSSPELYHVVQMALKNVAVVSIAKDSVKNYWIGTANNGVFVLKQNFKFSQHYQHHTGAHKLLSNVVRRVFSDKHGRILVGSLKGLDVFYPATGKHISYIRQPENKYSLNSNSIYDLMEDRQGNIWIGTYFGGVNYIEANTTSFKVYKSTGSVHSLSSNIISDIVEDDMKNLWIGTEAEGLNYFDREKQQFSNITSDESDNRKLNSNLVKSLVIDKKQNVWVAMHGGGVNLLDRNGRKLSEFGHMKGGNSIRSNDVVALLIDSFQNVWMGTEENGIDIFKQSSGKIETFETIMKGQTLTSDAITCMFEDSKKNIWIGTKQGINLLLHRDRKVRTFLKNLNSGQLNSDYINCIAEDKSQRIWLGTYAGLSYFDEAKNEFGTYTVADGLAGNKVVGIIADDNNNLWISTNNGLSFFREDRSKIYSFNIYDGLPGNVFNYNSYFKDNQGHLFFGSYNGLVEFDPKKISLNIKPPEIVLTGLQVNGKIVTNSDSSRIVSKNITEISDFVLDHDENVVTIEYAVVNFIKSAKNRSAYKLEGYNKDWIHTTEQKATFTNLPAGNYTLLIKASNNDGVWSESPLVVKITIKPPPWKTWWAYTLYVIILSLIAFSIIYFFSSRTALKRKLRYEHLLNIKQQELQEMKMDFFTHISHEIRTPLTLIMGPVEMLSGLVPNNLQAQKMLSTIKGNADRLLTLTNKLLDFRKAESGHAHLTISCLNIVTFTKAQFDKFAGEAEKKSISYSFNSAKTDIPLYFDPHHLEIVLSNLLSNALKFTHVRGTVSVHIAIPEPENVEITVCDNGIGIPEEAQGRIFTNFFQADTGGTEQMGSGIGLAFSKSLVELHKGKLSFHSGINADTGNKHTCFIVSLPTGKKHFDGNYMINE